MKNIKIKNIVYVEHEELIYGECDGCVADNDYKLCKEIHDYLGTDEYCDDNKIIFKEKQ